MYSYYLFSRWKTTSDMWLLHRVLDYSYIRRYDCTVVGGISKVATRPRRVADGGKSSRVLPRRDPSGEASSWALLRRGPSGGISSWALPRRDPSGGILSWALPRRDPNGGTSSWALPRRGVDSGGTTKTMSTLPLRSGGGGGSSRLTSALPRRESARGGSSRAVLQLTLLWREAEGRGSRRVFLLRLAELFEFVLSSPNFDAAAFSNASNPSPPSFLSSPFTKAAICTKRLAFYKC